MGSEPGLPEQATTSRPRSRRTAFKLGLVASGVLLLAVIFFCSRPNPADDKVVWLTFGELARIKQGGPLARMKHRLMHWTAPLWKSYWSSRPQILIDSSLLTLSAASADGTASAHLSRRTASGCEPGSCRPRS